MTIRQLIQINIQDVSNSLLPVNSYGNILMFQRNKNSDIFCLLKLYEPLRSEINYYCKYVDSKTYYGDFLRAGSWTKINKD